MSDTMLFGVLRMPYELAMSTELSRRQFHDRAQQACDALEAMRATPTISECEACFTPDVCQLRGTCDHYSAERLRVAKVSAASTLTDEQITRIWFESSSGKITPTHTEFARGIERSHGIGVKGEA